MSSSLKAPVCLAGNRSSEFKWSLPGKSYRRFNLPCNYRLRPKLVQVEVGSAKLPERLRLP
jgi:hypothetical protein